MAISKKISDALARKAVEGGPCNIFEFSAVELKSLGYQSIDIPKSIMQRGDIVSLSKDGKLWLMLDSVGNFRKTMKEPADKLSGPVYRK